MSIQFTLVNGRGTIHGDHKDHHNKMDTFWIFTIFASATFGFILIIALIVIAYKYYKKTRRKESLNPVCSTTNNECNNTHSTTSQEKNKVNETTFYIM